MGVGVLVGVGVDVAIVTGVGVSVGVDVAGTEPPTPTISRPMRWGSPLRPADDVDREGAIGDLGAERPVAGPAAEGKVAEADGGGRALEAQVEGAVVGAEVLAEGDVDVVAAVREGLLELEPLARSRHGAPDGRRQHLGPLGVGRGLERDG